MEIPGTTEVEAMALATSKSSPRDQAQETSERDIVRMKPMHPHSGSIDEHDTEVLLSRFRSDGKISRRHSTQLAPGVEYPIEEAVGEGTTDGLHQKKKILRRSSSIRGIAQTSKVLLTGLSRAGVATRSSDAIDEGKRADIVSKESPYEEMMVRFQIRQLQRTASEMTTRSDDKRVSSRGHDADGTGRGSIGHGSLATERTTRQDFDAQQGNGHITQDGSKSITPGDSLGLVSPLDNSNNEKLATQGPTHQCDASKQNRPTKLWFQNWWRILLTPISPLSEFTHVRYMLILFVATTYVVFFPLGVAFPDEQQFTYVDSVVGILLGLDVLVALHTSYMKNDGTIVSSHRDIAVHYLKTRFVQDVLLSIPLILHVNALTGKHIAGSWLHFILDLLSTERIAYVSRFVRMVWLVRLNQSGGGNNFWAWLLYSRYSHLLRIAGIVTMLIAIAHYIACVWTVLLEESVSFDQSAMSWKEQYSASFYSALLLLQGEGVPTDTAGQNLFASLSVLVGSIVLAVVFGHVAILVANFNANFTSYQRKMEAVFAVTAKLQLPAQLRERIHEYYEHLWHEYECLDGEIVQFSKELSHTLGLEVVLFKYMELVMHVPFWKECTPDFQKQLMLRLDVRVYLPNDFIMREGEVDDEFYMINRGYCELSRAINRFERVTNTMISSKSFSNGFSSSTARCNGARRRYSSLTTSGLDSGHRQSAYELDAAQRRHYSNIGRRGAKGYEIMISRGQAFGDLALLMNYQRAANVTAITHVEMCVLARADFQAVLARYPDDRYGVIVDMLTSYMQSYEANQTRCPLLELVRSVYSPEAISDACMKAGVPLPQFPGKLTARQAAERIYKAINVELQDSTLRFGIGVNVREQLVGLRERRHQKRLARHPVGPIPTKNMSIASRDCGNLISARQKNESECEENDRSIGSTPTTMPKQTPDGHIQTPLKSPKQPALSWQARLQRVEETELVILRALQDLQVNFKLLQSQQSVPAHRTMPESLLHARATPEIRESTSGRKRSFLEAEAPMAKTSVSRPRLLQRMGSFVGLSSGTSLDQQEPTTKEKDSPTRYADQLFHAHATTSSGHSLLTQHQPNIKQQHKLSKAATFSIRASQKSPRVDTTEIQASRVYQSSEPFANGSGNSGGVGTTRVNSSKGVLQRTHSQNLHSLAEGVASSSGHASVGSSPSPPNRPFRRLSPSVADPRESPTRYADALFRPRTLEPLSPSTEAETTSTILSP